MTSVGGQVYPRCRVDVGSDSSEILSRWFVSEAEQTLCRVVFVLRPAPRRDALAHSQWTEPNCA